MEKKLNEKEVLKNTKKLLEGANAVIVVTDNGLLFNGSSSELLSLWDEIGVTLHDKEGIPEEILRASFELIFKTPEELTEEANKLMKDLTKKLDNKLKELEKKLNKKEK